MPLCLLVWDVRAVGVTPPYQATFQAPLADQRHVRQRPEHRGCCFLLAKSGRNLQGRVSFIDSLAQVGVRGRQDLHGVAVTTAGGNTHRRPSAIGGLVQCYH